MRQTMVSGLWAVALFLLGGAERETDYGEWSLGCGFVPAWRSGT